MIFGGGLPGTKRRNIEGRAGVRARGRQRRASRAQQAKRPYGKTATADVKNAGWQPALRRQRLLQRRGRSAKAALGFGRGDANGGRRGRVDGFAIAETIDPSAPTKANAGGEPTKTNSRPSTFVSGRKN